MSVPPTMRGCVLKSKRSTAHCGMDIQVSTGSSAVRILASSRRLKLTSKLSTYQTANSETEDGFISTVSLADGQEQEWHHSSLSMYVFNSIGWIHQLVGTWVNNRIQACNHASASLWQQLQARTESERDLVVKSSTVSRCPSLEWG